MADTPAWATEKTPDWASGAATPGASGPVEPPPSWAAGADVPRETPLSSAAPRYLAEPMATPSFGEKALGTGAALLDIPLGIPAQVIQTVDEFGRAIYLTGQEDPSMPRQQDFPATPEGEAAYYAAVEKRKGDPEVLARSKQMWAEARQHGAELLPEWAKAPARSVVSALGAEKGYEQSVPAGVMKKVGGVIESGAESLEKKTGIPAEAIMSHVDALMAYGGVKLPLAIRERLARNKTASAEAKALLERQKPTGVAEVKPPTDAEVQAVLNKMPIPAPGQPIPRPETVRAAKIKRPLSPGETITGDPMEGDLGPMPAATKAKIETVAKDPELTTGTPGEVLVKHDVAAEKIAGELQAARYQQGVARQRVLTTLAAGGGGALVGAYLDKDDPLIGAFVGAFGGFAAANTGHMIADWGAGTKLGEAWGLVKPSTDPIRAAAIQNDYAKVANVKAKFRDIGALQRAYMDAVPKSRREHITHLVQNGEFDKLTPEELQFVRDVEREYGRMGSRAQEAGVISHLLGREYVPMIWDMKDRTTKEFFDNLFASGVGDRMSAGAFTPHSLKRSIPTYLQGMAANLKPKTLDHAELLGLYANSVVRATENAFAVSRLKAMKMPGGVYAVEPTGKTMPREYVADHGIKGLEGFGVHPEMVPALRMAFDSYDPGLITRGALAASFISKRLSVSYSLFHPMSLLLAYTGAGGNPFGALAGMAARGVEKGTFGLVKVPFKSAVDKVLDQYHQAGAGDMSDWAIRNGLEIGTTIEDTVGRDTFLKMTKVIDDAILPGEHRFKPFTALDNNLHEFTWGYVHTGMKLSIFQKEFEKALVDPKNKGKDANLIAHDVAQYTNNLFGGLNWNRVIEGMRSKAGRAVAGAAFGKHGRTMMQIGLFAPDWLFSTMRSWTQAVPGLSENAQIARLHRQYLARSMLYTLAATDALNLYYSGHHVWENDFRSDKRQDEEGEDRPIGDQIYDMTFIDMGDGTRIEGNKHLFEMAHAMTEPAQFFMGKAGTVITDPLNMAQNKQWMTPGWAPKITEGGTRAERLKDYMKWWVSKHSPFSLQQLGEGANLGIIGFPRHGLSEEKKEKLKEEREAMREERGL